MPSIPPRPLPSARAAGLGLVFAAVAALAGGPAAAQEARPDPAAASEPPSTVPLPVHEERVLSNGLRLLVVPDSTADATVYTLLIPGGSAADPPGREGTAAVLATLMRSVGAGDPAMELGVTASADALAMTLVDSAGLPPAAARRLGDAVSRVVVGDSAVAAAREDRTARVAAALGDPEVAARQVLLGAVYGDHPYGRGETPATLAAVDAGTVSAWRDGFVRPDGAVLSVTGPVEAGPLASILEAGLRGWLPDPGPPPEPAAAALEPARRGRRILLHLPGSRRAVIQAGVDLPPAGHPDWLALAVLDRVLSDGPEALLTTLRVPGRTEDIVAGTATGAQRRRGPGLLQARAEVRPAAAADVVVGLLAGLARAGEEFVPPDLVRPAQERLAVSFAAQLGIPAGAAALMAVNRVMGLPDSLMPTYPVRVRRIGPQELRDVAREHLDTARISVVVAGDATLLLRDLEELGPFELLDPEGAPLAVEELEPVEETPRLDAARLRPLTLSYRVMVGASEQGTITRTLEPGPDSLPSSMVFRGTAELGGREMSQTVTFSVPDFRPLAAGASVFARGQGASLEVTVRGDSVVGTVTSGGSASSIAATLPAGGLLGDMVELAAWLLPMDAGGAYRFSVLTPETGQVDPVVLRVGEVEEVSVPAGTFRARRVEVTGEQPQTWWVTVEDPRVPVRIEPAGRPVVLELVSIRQQS